MGAILEQLAVSLETAVPKTGINSDNDLKRFLYHVHTNHSHDVSKIHANEPTSILEKAVEKNMDLISITDHDNDNAWKENNIGVRSMEVETFDKRLEHLIHYGIVDIPDDYVSKEILDYRRKNNAYSLAKYALQDGCTVIMNHPWFVPNGGRANYRGIWEIAQKLELPVEVNEKRGFIENAATLYKAKKLGLPVVAGIDTHIGNISGTCTLAKGETTKEVLENIKKGNSYILWYNPMFCQPKMFAQYARQLIESSENTDLQRKYEGFYLGSRLDSLIEWVRTRDYNESRMKKNAAKFSLQGLSYLIGAFGYLPCLYGKSACKILKNKFSPPTKSLFREEKIYG